MNDHSARMRSVVVAPAEEAEVIVTEGFQSPLDEAWLAIAKMNPVNPNDTASTGLDLFDKVESLLNIALCDSMSQSGIAPCPRLEIPSATIQVFALNLVLNLLASVVDLLREVDDDDS